MPGAASERTAVVSALCPPAAIRTSEAARLAAMSRANQPRSSASPSSGGRAHDPGRRPARARADASPRPGRSEACGYPLLRSVTSGGTSARDVSTPVASTARGALPGSALRATSCHDMSPAPRARGRSPARKTPAPGRETTSPSATSAAMARLTVTGLTWNRATSSRLDGSFSSGE